MLSLAPVAGSRAKADVGGRRDDGGEIWGDMVGWGDCKVSASAYENIPNNQCPYKSPLSRILHLSAASLRIYHQSPSTCIAAATLQKPAILLPANRLGNSPSASPDSTYSLAVSRPVWKHVFMISRSRSSTCSALHAARWLFWAISRPDTADPPALAALPVFVGDEMGAGDDDGIIGDWAYQARTRELRPSFLTVCASQRRLWLPASIPYCCLRLQIYSQPKSRTLPRLPKAVGIWKSDFFCSGQ